MVVCCVWVSLGWRLWPLTVDRITFGLSAL